MKRSIKWVNRVFIVLAFWWVVIALGMVAARVLS
jgi:hypothetical protein